MIKVSFQRCCLRGRTIFEGIVLWKVEKIRILHSEEILHLRSQLLIRTTTLSTHCSLPDIHCTEMQAKSVNLRRLRDLAAEPNFSVALPGVLEVQGSVIRLLEFIPNRSLAMTSSDVRAILNLPLSRPSPATSSTAPSNRKSSTHTRKPDGISRELYALIGDNAPSLAQAQASLAALRYRDRPTSRSKAAHWQVIPVAWVEIL